MGAADSELSPDGGARSTAASARTALEPRDVQASRAMFDGRFEEAEHVIEGAVELRSRGHGALGGVDDTTFYYVTHLQTWALRRERGELADVRESIERYVAEYPTFFIFRCVLVSAYSQLGAVTQAQQELDRLGAEDFAGLEVGTEWHFGASLLAEACASLGDTRHAPRPLRGAGPVRRLQRDGPPRVQPRLGRALPRHPCLHHVPLAGGDGALRASAHDEQQMGTRPWLAHTQHDYAAMLLVRDEPGGRERARPLIREAVNSYRELGMRHWADEASELEQGL